MTKRIIKQIQALEDSMGIYDSCFMDFLKNYDEYKEYLEWLKLSTDNTRVDGHNDF